MAKSSINFKKSSGHSSSHNLRIDEPSYLLPKEYRLENESWQNSKSDKELFELELKNSNRKGGPKPKLENSRWEAVLNLNKNHSLEDVKKVAEHIAKKFNITPTEITIHRDEGHIENGKPVYNFHAHLNFLTYKDGKQNWRKELIKPAALSELQTEVSVILGMERGKVNSKAKRLDHRQYKAVAQEMQYNFKEYQQKITALETLTTEQKKELHSLNSAVKNERATIEQLNLKIEELTELGKSYHNDLVAVYEALPMSGKIAVDAFHAPKAQAKEVSVQAISALERTNVLKTSNDTLKSDLNDLRADMSVLQASNDELTLTVGRKNKTIQSHNNNQKRVEELLPTVKGVEFSKDENTVWYARLAEFVKGLADKIKSLTKENQELKEKIKTLETSKTKSAENLAKVKEMNSRANPLDKILDKDNEAHRRAEAFQKIFKAKSGEEISYKDAYETVNGKSNLVTREDLQKANQGKVQNRDYGYSR